MEFILKSVVKVLETAQVFCKQVLSPMIEGLPYMILRPETHMNEYHSALRLKTQGKIC